MTVTINGIHHISAIVGHVNDAIDFYERILGLRMIKQTVNFDDPNTYHIYFSNDSVDNGMIFTFFPWESERKGRQGSGQVGRIAFLVGQGHLNYWKNRLISFGVSVDEGSTFNRPSIDFSDVHGLQLSIVASEQLIDNPAIYGFYGSEIWSSQPYASQEFLVEQLGFIPLEENDRHLILQAGQRDHFIYIPKEVKKRGRWGIGTVHHVAFSIKNSEQQKILQEHLAISGNLTTEVKDRKYFKAIYLREVGEVVLEFATEGPGFTVDEDFEDLGNQFVLPVHYEPHRQEITNNLIPIRRKEI